MYSLGVSRKLIVAATAAFALSPSLAVAQESEDAAEESAQRFAELVQRARDAYKGEDYDTAVTLLQQAYGLQPDARLLINIAKTFEAAGDCVRAIAYYKAFLRSGETDPDLLTIAGKGASELECDAYDPMLSGRLRVTSEPSGAKVMLDGQPLGTTPIETIALSAGDRSLTVTMEGYADDERTIGLRGERDEVIDVVLKEPVAEPPKEDTSDGKTLGDPGSTPIAQSDEGGLNVPALVLVGAGVTGLAVGAVFDNVLIPATDNERSGFDRTSPEYQNLTDQRAGQATVALAGYVAGGVLLAGGAGWLVYDMVSADEAKKKSEVPVVRVAPVLAPGNAGFVIDARF